ncbi:MAG: replication initiation regulator SeqA [Opitutaceae bacterium]
MKTIEIDDDIYDHLLNNVQSIGEDASSILRRLLGLSEGNSQATTATVEASPIDKCLNDPSFRSSRKAIDRFMFTLTWLYRQQPEDFERVLRIRGRQRVYFSKTEREINASGDSAFPKQIPETPYWVVTNNDTPKKQRMLFDVMITLSYSKTDASRLCRALKA